MSADPTCLFCRIVAREIPADVVLDAERVLAFRDIDPQAPVHVLVIPKEHHANAGALADVDPELAAEVLQTAAQVARDEDIDASGYRLVFNTGTHGGQAVDHVHAHVLGGRPMAWPPG
jgi:histidine triad (HIT) family protein